MVSVMRMALDETKILQVDNLAVVHDGELEKKVRAIVMTDQFVSRYLPRSQMAMEGNPDPLVRLIITFARKLAGHGFDIAEVVTMLLHVARASLDSPDNDGLWNTVHDMVQSGIDDSGSEVAA